MQRQGPYVCPRCGTEFRKKFNAIRHVKIVEKGSVQVIRKADYQTGLLYRTISPPRSEPIVKAGPNPLTRVFMDTLATEFSQRMAEVAWSNIKTRGLAGFCLLEYYNLEARNATLAEYSAFEDTAMRLLMFLLSGEVPTQNSPGQVFGSQDAFLASLKERVQDRLKASFAARMKSNDETSRRKGDWEALFDPTYWMPQGQKRSHEDERGKKDKSPYPFNPASIVGSNINEILFPFGGANKAKDTKAQNSSEKKKVA